MAPLGSHQTSKNAVESKRQQVQFVLNDEPTLANYMALNLIQCISVTPETNKLLPNSGNLQTTD
jgi:hypothetical protein